MDDVVGVGLAWWREVQCESLPSTVFAYPLPLLSMIHHPPPSIKECLSFFVWFTFGSSTLRSALSSDPPTSRHAGRGAIIGGCAKRHSRFLAATAECS
jgi:hypothetical protein